MEKHLVMEKKITRNKLEQFFPELLEIKEGSLILTLRWNFFNQKYEEDVFDEYRVLDGGRVFNLDGDNFICELYDIDKYFSNYKVENEITLNYVLMYVQKKGGDVVGCTDYSSLYFGAVAYDLTKTFEEQSELFYEFINGL